MEHSFIAAKKQFFPDHRLWQLPCLCRGSRSLQLLWHSQVLGISGISQWVVLQFWDCIPLGSLSQARRIAFQSWFLVLQLMEYIVPLLSLAFFFIVHNWVVVSLSCFNQIADKSVRPVFEQHWLIFHFSEWFQLSFSPVVCSEHHHQSSFLTSTKSLFC